MIYFQPNCTIPSGPPTFVATPNIRSTISIAWSCVSTILLCCWSIQRLNVPPQFQPKTTRQKIMRKIFFLCREVKWMILTIFAPEILLAKAMADKRSCSLHFPRLKEIADNDGVPWSKAHTFLADMGGFALRFTSSSRLFERPYPYGASAGVDTASGPPIPAGSPRTAGEDQERIYEEDFQELSRSGEARIGLPNQPLRKLHVPEWLASIKASDSAHIAKNQPSPQIGLAGTAEDTSTQRVVSDMELSRLQSIFEPRDSQAEGPVQSVDQRSILMPINGSTFSTLSHQTTVSRRDQVLYIDDRLRFRGRVELASQRFGNLGWKVFEHNETIVTNLLQDRWSLTRDFATIITSLLMYEGDIWVLTAAQLIEARRTNLIARLPHLTGDEVSDRDKGDILLKLFALLQVLWMVIQVITRTTLHISSTPLEIMTLSFATCAFVTYILLFEHPQDVNTPIYIDAAGLPTEDEILTMIEYSPTYYWSSLTSRLPCLPNDAIHCSAGGIKGRSDIFFYLGLAAGAIVSGGTHVVAWNFIFPTIVERTLWRTSALFTMLGTPLPMLLGVALNTVFVKTRGRRAQPSNFNWVLAFAGLYILALVLARLFLIVEAFRSLYYLPQDAYFTTWST